MTGNDRKLLFLLQGKKHCAQSGQINYEVELELWFPILLTLKSQTFL